MVLFNPIVRPTFLIEFFECKVWKFLEKGSCLFQVLPSPIIDNYRPLKGHQGIIIVIANLTLLYIYVFIMSFQFQFEISNTAVVLKERISSLIHVVYPLCKGVYDLQMLAIAHNVGVCDFTRCRQLLQVNMVRS